MVGDGNLTPASLAVFATVWPLWGVLIAMVGAILLWLQSRANHVAALTLAAVAAVSFGMLGLTQGPGAAQTSMSVRLPSAFTPINRPASRSRIWAGITVCSNLPGA